MGVAACFQWLYMNEYLILLAFTRANIIVVGIHGLQRVYSGLLHQLHISKLVQRVSSRCILKCNGSCDIERLKRYVSIVGQISSGSSSSSCTSCPAGYYVGAQGQSACTACAAGIVD